MVNDQPFNVIENKEFREMVAFIQPGIKIPSADTLKRDLNECFKSAKANFQKELQVSNLNK